ncbi:MAG: hypothetical protein QG635_26 [Bacteroidota bacterium]|nr:hypothetical protein [Bacteroidota bacterium]
MEKNLILCDTNVFINWFRNDKETLDQLKLIGPENICLSVVTFMELIQGCQNKKELNVLIKKFDKYYTYYITEQISLTAGKFMINYNLSHNLLIPDALIAATAVENSIRLFTYNLKDFKYIKGLDLYFS